MSLETLASTAFNNVSFQPESRARRFLADHRDKLEKAEVLRQFAISKRPDNADEINAAAARFAKYHERGATQYLSTTSRCASSFICGASNFPAERMNRRNEIAHKRLSAYCDSWSIFEANMRRLSRPKEAEPIKTGDEDAVERIEAKIERLRTLQERMKAANAIIRKHDTEPARIDALIEAGFTEIQSRKLITPDVCNRIGFPDFELKCNGAEIRRLEKRLEHVRKLKAIETFDAYTSDDLRVEDAPADNRVRLFYSGKPDEETRNNLKRNGFRWTPSLGCWQAFRNYSAIRYVQALIRDAKAAADSDSLQSNSNS